MTDPGAPGWTTVEWTMDQMDTRVMARQGLLWFAIGGAVFVALAIRPALLHDPFASWWNLVPLLGLLVVGTAGSLVLHEGVHGLVMARYGAGPQFGVGMMQGQVPYAYATSPGFRYTRRQFWWVAMMPTFVVNAVLAVLVFVLPWGPYLVLPAAIHLSGCVGDWMILKVIAPHPEGTLVEDTREGVILHVPPR
ncbi:MAG TPA: DUF3267 domain-containing protein [Propionibacterium sp.]|nr:DUF3267 domain-containing protein [Propionibacterium sp.]